jgi:ABC-type hemin transport system substrate-binding protein
VQETKDWIAQHQVTAEGWYVASPDLTVAQTRKLEKVGKAVEEFLDQVG